MSTSENVSRFSMIKNSFMSGVSSATSVASSAISSTSLKQNRRMNFDLVDADVVSLIRDLGMNDEKNVNERDAIYDTFNASMKKHSCEANFGITVENFVIDMLKRGFTPQWSDAAFRAFDNKQTNYLSKYQYLIAICALKTTKEVFDNPVWIKLRRRVLFAYYDRDSKSELDCSLFNEFLTDLSVSAEDPEVFGISNKSWRRNHANNETRTNSEHTNDSLSHQLAIAKLQLAQKQEEFELLQLEYLKLEKFSCGLKLELASTKAMIDR